MKIVFSYHCSGHCVICFSRCITFHFVGLKPSCHGFFTIPESILDLPVAVCIQLGLIQSFVTSANRKMMSLIDLGVVCIVMFFELFVCLTHN